MSSADSVISNLVTSIQNLENTVDDLKADLQRAKAEAHASAGQKMHHLPPVAMTGDLKVDREEEDDRSNDLKNIFREEELCQPYGKQMIVPAEGGKLLRMPSLLPIFSGGVLVAVMLTTLANFSILMLFSLIRNRRRSRNGAG